MRSGATACAKKNRAAFERVVATHRTRLVQSVAQPVRHGNGARSTITQDDGCPSVRNTAVMTIPAPPPGSTPGPVWTAAAVARRLGVAPATLRSWSRRYGLAPAAHTPGRHRRYTAADLAELTTVRALVAEGVVLSTAAAIVRSRRATTPLPASSGSSPGAPPALPGDPVLTLIAAATRLDHDTASAVVTTSLSRSGVTATWDEVCRPAFAHLQTAVGRDLGCTDAQLLLSWVVTTCLRRLPVPGAPAPGRPVLLAGAPGEQHTLPLEVLLAALTERRVPASTLGPAVPAAALRHATRRLRPATVVVWAHREATAAPAVLRRLLPHTDTVVAAGPGWHRIAVAPGVRKTDDLHVALALATPSDQAVVGAAGRGRSSSA